MPSTCGWVWLTQSYVSITLELRKSSFLNQTIFPKLQKSTFWGKYRSPVQFNRIRLHHVSQDLRNWDLPGVPCAPAQGVGQIVACSQRQDRDLGNVLFLSLENGRYRLDFSLQTTCRLIVFGKTHRAKQERHNVTTVCCSAEGYRTA